MRWLCWAIGDAVLSNPILRVRGAGFTSDQCSYSPSEKAGGRAIHLTRPVCL